MADAVVPQPVPVHIGQPPAEVAAAAQDLANACATWTKQVDAKSNLLEIIVHGQENVCSYVEQGPQYPSGVIMGTMAGAVFVIALFLVMKVVFALGRFLFGLRPRMCQPQYATSYRGDNDEA